MTSSEIRRHFLNFFESKGHKVIPSAPMVAKSDPTLMFINSGMAPLKDFFLGNQTPPSRRVADTQKCLRVSGKHNDLEDVGFDGYHHTMFEMLGNWSFGDYFKREALAWSWELLTEVYGIPKDRLYVSVFGGDGAQGLPFDQEAFETWKQFIPEDRILAFGKKENFWEMGDQGPCGPCSEIHVDLRSEEERREVDGKSLVNQDNPNVIELWNNVFMEFNRKADGSLEELPAKSVDTGMGFERLCRAIQGGSCNYDTDLWRPLFQFLEQISGISYRGLYGGEAKTDIAMRVVADHLRAVCFAIADGELPSSGGAGYVIRRILRRAVRYYYSFLNLREPVLYRMCPILAELFADIFPDLNSQVDFVVRVVLEEEKSFLRTLEQGLKRIEQLEVEAGVVSGDQAFELLDTFGFPFDLTVLLSKEKGWTVDEEAFKTALQVQKNRSRKDAAKQVGDWTVLRDETVVEFVGYDDLETQGSQVIKYRTVVAKGVEQYQVVLNRTPFYPEGGGQVGDTGWMYFGADSVRVLDTRKENTLVMHFLDRLPDDVGREGISCVVDEERRRLTERNHSATHLLHAALRKVLGAHVQQKGSYLDDSTLRFDFQHFQKVTDAEIREIERIVNYRITAGIPLDEARSIPIEVAKEAGAMMLFGEKYGDRVRMITFDRTYSQELCGGCHVRNTGQIGFFKIVAESAVAAGVRRIEAVTSVGVEAYVAGLEDLLFAIKEVLKARDIPKAIQDLQEDNKRLQKEVDRLILVQASGLRDGLRNRFKEIGDVRVLAVELPISDANAMKTLATELACESSVIAFGAAASDGKCVLTIKVSENLVHRYGLHAGTMVRGLAQRYLSGGGGGQPTFGTAGGVNAAGIAEALQEVETVIKDLCKD